MQRVVVGLSGGVDSSVTAHLLKEQGYEVIGIFMRNWHDESVTLNNECPWIDDSNDAMLVAEQLGIPFQVLDLSAEYKDRIVDYMFSEYHAGRTPNPDVLCNREIKFDIFLKAAMNLGADFVATGHYCRKDSFVNEEGETVYRLLSGVDENKDQSYFLCQLNQEQLAKALFPIGEITKPEVRKIANDIGLVTADKKDSQGLCFIGKVKLPDFLKQQLQPKEGKILEVADSDNYFLRRHPQVNISMDLDVESLAAPFDFNPEMGTEVGSHQGAHYFTIGQRKGLNVGGRPEPSFILATDVDSNTIYTGLGESHRGLYRSAIKIAENEIHWIRPDLELKEGERASYDVRIRYRQPLTKVILIRQDGFLYIVFVSPQRGVAPGQFAAWYLNDELVGSGVIA